MLIHITNDFCHQIKKTVVNLVIVIGCQKCEFRCGKVIPKFVMSLWIWLLASWIYD